MASSSETTGTQLEGKAPGKAALRCTACAMPTMLARRTHGCDRQPQMHACVCWARQTLTEPPRPSLDFSQIPPTSPTISAPMASSTTRQGLASPASCAQRANVVRRQLRRRLTCNRPLLHLQKEMLEDHKRTGAYYQAVMSNKRQFQGKVVLDVGTGAQGFQGCAASW